VQLDEVVTMLSTNEKLGNAGPEEMPLVDLNGLPTVSTAVAEVLSLTASSTSSATDVARAIECDPALAARVLRVANSGYFALPSTISSLPHGVALLGLNLVRSLVLGAAVSQALRPPKPVPGLSFEAYWHHSVAVASASRSICKTTISRDPEEAFVGGLLHDIGSLVLAYSVPDRYAQVLKEGIFGGRPLMTIERKILGVDHAEVGARVAAHWGLPDLLVQIIRHHHEPRNGGLHGPLSAVVHVADCVAHSLGMHGCETATSPRIDSEAWTLLGGLMAGVGPGEVHRYATYLRDEQDAIARLTQSLIAAA